LTTTRSYFMLPFNLHRHLNGCKHPPGRDPAMNSEFGG
jgi:hypothetical protein